MTHSSDDKVTEVLGRDKLGGKRTKEHSIEKRI